MEKKQSTWIGWFKLVPIFVMAGLMLSGMDILLASPISFACACVVAMITDHYTFDELLDAAIKNLHNFIIVFLILEAAYGVAECFMATGVAAAIINMSLSMGLTARMVAVVGFLVTCVLSIATGTSWGTFAACAPIFLWLNHIVGGSAALTLGAIAGGACFGDNIGLISDTTVVSCGMQHVELVDRMRYQGVWSGLCVVAASVVFYLVAVSMGLSTETGSAAQAIAEIPESVWALLGEERPAAVTLLHQVEAGVPYYMIIPLLIVLGLAVRNTSTLLCLGAGIFTSGILGWIAGTVTSMDGFLELVYRGASDAGGWSIAMMLWVGAFGGVMRKMNAFDAVADAINHVVRNVRQLMFCNGLLCILGNAALADEMAQIVTISPVMRELTEKNVDCNDEDVMYRLRLRNATFADAMGVLGSLLIPWHCYMGFFVGIAVSVYPIGAGELTAGSLISHNYFAWIGVISLLVLTITGWDRYVPLFSMPKEPGEMRLKKDMKVAAE